MAIPAVHASGSDAIRIGIIGCGSRGRGAAAQAVESAPGVQVTALADLFPDAIDRTLQRWADRPKENYKLSRDRCFVGWNAYQQLLQTDANYIILATPPAFRPEHLMAAITAGRHVYAEKALAVDPAGVRKVMAAGELATQQNLGIITGLWRRHDRAYIDTINRVRDGAIGRILTGQAYCLQGGWNVTPRQEGWTDMEWQVRNFFYFTWLSGDVIVDQGTHGHDILNWAIGAVPTHCHGMGGRQARTHPAFGHIYDHFAVEYEYPGGIHVISLCRQTENAFGRIQERVCGERGWADLSGRISATGQPVHRFAGQRGSPYVLMHTDMIQSIRAGQPLNYAKQAAESHLMSIMGRMAAYTGNLIRWKDALNDPMDLMPKALQFGPHPMPAVAIPGRPPA